MIPRPPVKSHSGPDILRAALFVVAPYAFGE